MISVNFILPTQLSSAIVLDGTILIAIGIILVAGIIVKYRNNIMSNERVLNQNNDKNMTPESQKDMIRNITANNKIVQESEEEYIENKEPVKIID